jgi:hypothetical protein
MARKRSMPADLTPEQWVDLSRGQSWEWNANAFQLLLGRAKTKDGPAVEAAPVGRRILALLAAEVDRRAIFEAAADLDPRGIDPHQLLPTPGRPKESLAAAKKRTGLPSTDSVKTERNRAKKRKLAQKLYGIGAPV